MQKSQSVNVVWSHSSSTVTKQKEQLQSSVEEIENYSTEASKVSHRHSSSNNRYLYQSHNTNNVLNKIASNGGTFIGDTTANMDVASTNNNREIDNGIIGGRKAYYQPDDTSTKKWTVGKISLFIIVAFSLSDLIFHLVDAQMECLEAQDHYDALSAEVIRPAFRYHRFQPPLNNGRLDAQRGFNYWKANDGSSASSSMIHSVVGQFRDTFRMSLSIIYPHNDDGYSDGNSSSNNNNINDKVSSYNQVLKIPPGGAAVAVKKSASKNNPRSSRYSTNGKEFVLSNSDCFVPLKDISQLTLKDVAMSFRYALLSTRKEYDHGKFLSGLLPRVKRVIDQMSITTSLARGKTIQAPITGGRIIPSGDIDALNFCSAMRLFAEWRVLRQVPPGYKGYAVGISLGQKDIISNIAKIEQGIHKYVDHLAHRSDDENKTGDNNTMGQYEIASPTLRDLLRFEVEIDLHDNTRLPRLKEKSAAMGLLWVRRQLVYQTAIFKNVMHVPSRFDSSRAAVQGAYDEVYGNLHGWAVQKIFTYSFKAAPDGTEIYKYMNPHRLKEVQQEARLITPTVSKLKRDKPMKFVGHIAKEWDKLANNVANEFEKHSGNVINEWTKLTSNIGQFFGHQKRGRQREVILEREDNKIDSEQKVTIYTSTETTTKIRSELEIKKYINEEMTKDAYDHIKVYLEVADPLLEDLTRLINEFNMDDPTRV